MWGGNLTGLRPMPIPPHLNRKLEQTLGREAAEDLVSWIENDQASLKAVISIAVLAKLLP
jgi:hypothetical protein